MAVLGSTTLTGCNSIPGFIPSGSVTIFRAAAAPTSWTRVTSDTANNRMLRLISSGAAGGLGGVATPILNNKIPAHTHGFTSGVVSTNHAHSGNTGYVSADHTHQYDNFATTGQLGYPNVGYGGNLFIGQTVVLGFGQGSLPTNGFSANHFHGSSSGGNDTNHTHSGTTDNGSSQTDWAPRYVDTLLCSKN